ncbi:MAG TPA: helix-turn-helix domain-containing protein [Dehalococcoidia bacterium]|nr:helix-turn-helix domain-containing protein [Dehalococcoidia bacterium]
MTATLSQPLALGLDGAADAIGVSKRTIQRAIAAGELPVARVGKRTLIRTEHLRQWLDRLTRTQGAA